MAVISFTASKLSADPDRGSVITNLIALTAMSIGDVVYVDTNNKAVKAQANSQTASRAIGIVVGVPNFYGETAVVAGDYVAVCVLGPVYGWDVALALGPIYVDKTTAGKMNDAAPTGGAWQYVIGHAIASDTIFVSPAGAVSSSAA